jgi:hypothetical protein
MGGNSRSLIGLLYGNAIKIPGIITLSLSMLIRKWWRERWQKGKF